MLKRKSSVSKLPTSFISGFACSIRSLGFPVWAFLDWFFLPGPGGPWTTVFDRRPWPLYLSYVEWHYLTFWQKTNKVFNYFRSSCDCKFKIQIIPFESASPILGNKQTKKNITRATEIQKAPIKPTSQILLNSSAQKSIICLQNSEVHENPHRKHNGHIYTHYLWKFTYNRKHDNHQTS